MKILLIYKDFLGSGGFPNDIRELASNFPSNINITVVCKKEDYQFNIKNVRYVYINNYRDIFIYKISEEYTHKIILGFSSIYNFFLSIKINSDYIILPFSQINQFLDYDNPFERNSVPIVQDIEKNKQHKPLKIISRVKNGKKGINSYLRAIKRILFRKTIGKYYLDKAVAIGVISNYEEEMVNSLYLKNKYNFFKYRLGGAIDVNKKGDDKLPSNKLIKLVVWSRVDFYYKGIDRILLSINEMKKKGDKVNFKLYIVGPDYNGGYKNITNYTSHNNIQEHVQLIKPGEYTSGTYGMLKDADMSVCLSRWDGYPRSLRESFLLNIPIIATEESNFDQPINEFNCGVIVKKQEDLNKILKEIDVEYVNNMRQTSKDYKYMSWKDCSKDFIEQISDIKKSN